MTISTLYTANRSVPLVAHADSVSAREITIEHGALTRQLAALQRRVGEQLRAHAQRIETLEEEVLHLRTQLIVSRTCMLWGLGVAGVGVVRPLPSRARRAVASAVASMAEASSVICQTGCVGHAHPWLEADGQCRRTGQSCELYASSTDEAAAG